MTAVPANVLIIPYPNFIRAALDRAPQRGGSLQLLLAFVSAMRDTGQHHVLIDMRPVEAIPALENRPWQPGVAAGTQSAFAEERLALLVPQDEHDDARLTEDTDRIERARIRVFTDFETAIDWLILREQPAI